MQLDWITEKSFGKYAKNAAQEELNSFYGIAKSMRDSGMDHEIIAENLKTMYGATPEQVEMIQNEVLGKTAISQKDINDIKYKLKNVRQSVDELLSDAQKEIYSKDPDKLFSLVAQAFDYLLNLKEDTWQLLSDYQGEKAMKEFGLK